MGHVAEDTRISRPQPIAWAFGKVDRRAAYMFPPLRPDESPYAIIALRNAADEQCCGFRSHTHVFGSADRVLRYNCFRRLLTASLTRVLRLPIFVHFDGCGFPTPQENARLTLENAQLFCRILRIVIKGDKSSVGPVMTFLGRTGTFPSPVNDMAPTIRLYEVKDVRAARTIRESIDARAFRILQSDRLSAD